MEKIALTLPGTVQHANGARADADLSTDVRAHHDAHAGVRFLVDVLEALHEGPRPLRTPADFYAKFPARQVMPALDRRADLRARVAHAITGSPTTLLRRTPPADLAEQIELLVAEDLPPDERTGRAEDDRARSVFEIYSKYLAPVDLAAYLPSRAIWEYERGDAWWERATESSRRMMAAELKSVRRHRILTDSELIDGIGNNVLERDLPLEVRTAIRAASRKAANESKPFTDTDLFDCVRTDGGRRDLVDHLVTSVSLPHLRRLIDRVVIVLGLSEPPASVTATPEADTLPDVVTAPPEVIAPSANDVAPATEVVTAAPPAAARAAAQTTPPPRLPSPRPADATRFPPRPVDASSTPIEHKPEEAPSVELEDEDLLTQDPVAIVNALPDDLASLPDFPEEEPRTEIIRNPTPRKPQR